MPGTKAYGGGLLTGGVVGLGIGAAPLYGYYLLTKGRHFTAHGINPALDLALLGGVAAWSLVHLLGGLGAAFQGGKMLASAPTAPAVPAVPPAAA